MRFLAEIDVAALLLLSACALVDAGSGGATFHDRLFRFANAGAERAVAAEPVRVHSPVPCRAIATPAATFVGPFRRVEDYGRLRELCIVRPGVPPQASMER